MQNNSQPDRIRLTRIVATLGPASRSPEGIETLIHAGVDVFRVNFSHGDHAQHGETLARVRAAAGRLNSSVAILQDLGGPKLRINDITGDHLHLHAGDSIRLESGDTPGDESAIRFIRDEEWFDEVRPGERIVLGDGIIHLEIVAKDKDGLDCKILSNGILRSRAGLNFPDSDLTLGAMRPKDWDDLAFGLQQGVDAVALSFVQGAQDVTQVRERISDRDRKPLLIAKIERPAAVGSIDAILDASDGIMVARGDLGISVPLQRVPTIQKMLIRKARERRKLVITATQMLESMVESPMPTRAEVSDVANAVHDGTDAVMLSGETAVGTDPAHVVRTMAEILVEAESHASLPTMPKIGDSIESAVSQTVPLLAGEIGAKLVMAPSTSGSTAARISRQRIGIPILAGVASEWDARRLRFHHGVFPELVESKGSLFANLKALLQRGLELGMVRKGDYAIVTGGFPLDKPGNTNFLRVVKVGEEI